jgi:MFS family permease
MVMPDRWRILAVLFAVRATMAFQFQSVAAVAPLLSQELNVELSDIGLLIGLYLAPGMVLALPGGAIDQRFGDKRTVLAGLVLMVAGGLMMVLLPSWEAQIAGRLLAGVGGVLLNVLMSKMITDWFGDREIATAMAVFVNSWPVGIAVALVTLPPIGATLGTSAVSIVTLLLLVPAAVLLARVYRSPPASGELTASTRPNRDTLLAVILAGVIWALFNTSFAMIFSFGPSMLVERGLSITLAGWTASIVMWLAIVSVPLGGFLTDRTGWPGSIVVFGCLTSALALLLAPHVDPLTAFLALGIVFGLPAGPIMALPARVLAPSTRAIGMGLFYTVFYAGMAIGPIIGGWLATKTGPANAAFYFGAFTLIACLPVLWAFHRTAARLASEPAPAVPSSSRVD